MPNSLRKFLIDIVAHAYFYRDDCRGESSIYQPNKNLLRVRLCKRRGLQSSRRFENGSEKLGDRKVIAEYCFVCFGVDAY